MHAHVYAKTPEEIRRWINIMDEVGVAKAVTEASVPCESLRRSRRCMVGLSDDSSIRIGPPSSRFSSRHNIIVLLL